jgi:Dyp-type peroxidase family
MARAADRLADPPLSRWEPKFQKDIHAMILVAHDDVSELSGRLSLLRVRVADFAEISSEFGMKIYDEAGRGIEHFGFVDGRSQPLFFSKDVKQDSQLARGRRQWDASAGPSLILIKDPLGKSTKDCGSYYVFRKLEQNVNGFWRLVEHLADVLHLTGTDRERAGALIIGRFRDGTPVALRDRANTRKLHRAANDFAYPKVDPDGMRCPFFAHTRKTNPRGDFNQTPAKEQRLIRVARRGMPYGDPTPPDSDMERLPEFGVGLLFQCCQSDLGHQFEFLQRSWANNKNMAHAGVGVDPVIGQSDIFPRLKFPTKWGKPDAGSTPFQFHSLVALKGGEYFFVPSVTFLKNLQ